jgi:hypothetical protein
VIADDHAGLKGDRQSVAQGGLAVLLRAFFLLSALGYLPRKDDDNCF